jgi:heme oxygenase
MVCSPEGPNRFLIIFYFICLCFAVFSFLLHLRAFRYSVMHFRLPASAAAVAAVRASIRHTHPLAATAAPRVAFFVALTSRSKALAYQSRRALSTGASSAGASSSSSPNTSQAGTVADAAPGGATDPVLLRLRSATGPAHERVEARLFPSGLASPQDYRRLLRVLLALHEPWERRFQQLKQEFQDKLDIDMDQRRKVSWLEKDLAALDALNSDLQSSSSSNEIEWPQQSGVADASLAAAAGAFYVLEGSTLGGRYLKPQVLARVGAQAPVAFFDGYGADTGKMWKAARVAISRAPSVSSSSSGDREKAEQELIDAAVATFEHLDRLVDAAGWPEPESQPHSQERGMKPKKAQTSSD